MNSSDRRDDGSAAAGARASSAAGAAPDDAGAALSAAGGARTDARVLELVRRYGWNATSFQVLQPGFRYLFRGDDACVGYVDTGRAWVAAGAPLCQPARMDELVVAFVDAARAQGRRVCFFATEGRLADAVDLRSLLVGEQAVWDPAQWDATVAGVRSLREQLRRARSKGVRVRAVIAEEWADPASPTFLAIDRLLRMWRGTHELAPMGFLVDVDPLAMRDDHRLYLAEADIGGVVTGAGPNAVGRLVGLLAAAPVFARRGWLLQALVRAPDAPNGTAELLVDAAMRAAASGEDSFVTLGLAPLAGRVAPPLRWARRAGAVLFDFQGLRAFKAKLRPLRWDPLYLSYPVGQGALASVVDVLTAFARGHLLRFGIQTLLRGPAIVVRLLALALVPWTIVLASSDVEHWFPGAAVKWGWVAFDVVLAVGLLALARRWRDGLARVLVAAVGCDAVVTTAEALAWNARHLPAGAGAGMLLVLGAAVAAPWLAFVVLWRARVRRR